MHFKFSWGNGSTSHGQGLAKPHCIQSMALKRIKRKCAEIENVLLNAKNKQSEYRNHKKSHQKEDPQTPNFMHWHGNIAIFTCVVISVSSRRRWYHRSKRFRGIYGRKELVEKEKREKKREKRGKKEEKTRGSLCM